MNKGIFLDRDGTLIVDRSYLADPDGVELIPGTREALLQARSLGYLLFLFSNQSGVGRGWITPEQVQAIQQRMCQLLQGVRFAGFEYCFHRPDQQCGCRKPSPAMILRAAASLELSLPRSVMVGDRAKDIQAGSAAGCRTVLVSDDLEQALQCEPDLMAPDLATAADWIIGCDS